MTTETKAMGLGWRKARALGWAVVLGALLLAPLDVLAQTKDKSSTGSSSGSSSSGSSSSASRSSPPPARSSPSVSRSSGSSSRSSSARSRASSVSRSKPSTKAPSGATTSSRTRATSGVKPRSKPNSPVRIPNQNDNPARAGEQANRNPGDYEYRRPGSGYRGDNHRYYYPYYPYGYYGGYYGYGSYYPYYFYGPYGYFFHPYAYGPSAGAGYRRGPRYGDAMGGLDLNVRPKKAEVYIDGTPVGPVDRYDGFPSYLWLDPGTYELAFYLEGYETLTRQYSIYPGVVVDVKERLGAGAAVAPEPPELGALTYDDPAPDETAPPGEPPAAGEEPGAGAGVGRLQLSISPGDTAVYLDGHFLGTGEELSQLSAGLVVEPGDHVLELVRPGYVTEQVPIKVPAGERIDVDLTLRQR